MSQTTKTVRKIKVSSNVFNEVREEQFYTTIQDVCTKLVSKMKALLKWGSSINIVAYLADEKDYKTAKFDAMTILDCVRHNILSLTDINDDKAKKAWAFFQKRQEYLVLD